MSDKRRMFSDSVLRSGELMLSSTMAQLLYIHLCLEADDRGAVNNAVIITRMLGATNEHLDELISIGFVIKLHENLHVITHWFVQNQIRAERLRESKYKDEIDAQLVVDATGEYHLKDSWSDDKNVTKCRQKRDKNVTKCRQNVTEMSPQYSIVEDSIVEDSVVKNSIHSSCACACACENKADPPDKQNNADCVCVDDTSNLASDTFTCVDVDPPGDPPDDMPHELTQKAEQLRQKLSEAGLRVPDKISWLMREFRFALDGKRRLKLTDDEFFGGLENYAKLLALRKESPDTFWWTATPQIPSLFTGSSPQILRFLPAVFDIASFKKAGKARASPRRGIDSEYSLKAIAEGA